MSPFGFHFDVILDPFPGFGKSTFEDAGGAQGSQTELPLSPRGAQRRAKGAKREPKGTPAGAIFTYLFVIVSGFVFQLFFGWFWSRFGRYFASFWVLFRTLRKRPDPTKVL